MEEHVPNNFGTCCLEEIKQLRAHLFQGAEPLEQYRSQETIDIRICTNFMPK